MIDALSAQDNCEITDISRFKNHDGYLIDNFQNNQNPLDEDFIVSKYLRYLIASNRSNLTDTLFTADSSSWDISGLKTIQDTNIINLHWVSEFINTDSIQLLHELGKHIVWTLHDQRPFTGGCHFTFGCKKYSKSCISCPQLDERLSWLPEFNFIVQKKLRKIPITFVCPSNWIQSKLHQSKVFNKSFHDSKVIPYSIDLNCFKPMKIKDVSLLREEMSIEKDTICLLAACHSLEDDRKGMKFIVEALKKLARNLKARKISKKIVLLTYGHGSTPIDCMETRHLGFIQSENQIIKVLNTVDLFLSMTREDNLPNTIMESLACGTPVISTDVGGISDMVTNNYNGKLVQRDSSSQMAEAILHSIEEKKLLTKWSANARKSAELNFSHQKQGSEYIKVFNHLLEKNSSKEPAKKSTTEKIITNSALRIPALNSFTSTDFREKALNWFEKNSGIER